MTGDEAPPPTIYNERTAIAPLRGGETVLVRGIGNSMTPILRSGQIVSVRPVNVDESLEKGDIVLARVNGRAYLHKVTGLKKGQVQIGNNHGHINGWTARSNVVGRLD